MAPRPLPNEKELILLREKIARDRFDPEISQATEEETKLELDRLKRDIELLENPETIFAFGVMTYDGDGVTQDYVTVDSAPQKGLAIFYNPPGNYDYQWSPD